MSVGATERPVGEFPAGAPERLLIRGARLVTLEADTADLQQGDVLVENGRIAAIQQRIDGVDAPVIDATHCIAAPGFVDTHRHTWQSALRHACGDGDAAEYGARILRTFAPHYTPEDILIGNLVGAVSALEAGTTTLLDWSHALNTPTHADAALDALVQSGIRAVFAYGYPRSEAPTWTFNSTRGHPQDIVRVRHERLSSDTGLITLAMAGRGPEMTTMEVVSQDFALARRLGIRISMHVGANGLGARFRAIDKMHEARLLGPDLTLIHLCDSSAQELARMAEFGVSASVGAQCELSLWGVGLPPIGGLLRAGIRPTLSGDTETCGTGDMFTQMRIATACRCIPSFLDGQSPPRFTLRDVLEFATIDGARANGLDARTGSLKVGKDADIILIRHDDLNLMPLNDPIGAIVLAAHPGNVDTVLVRGKVLKRAGKMVGIDTAQLHRRVSASRDRLLEAVRETPHG